MFSSHIKIPLRKLYREKHYAIINITGLSLGIACCIILGLYLRSELTYDQHHLNHNKIYRVVNEFNTNGKINSHAWTSPVLAPMIAEEYQEIQAYVRLRSIGGVLGQKVMFRYQDQSLYWENCYFADSNIFDIFTHEILYGDPETALDEPFSAAVSETFARQYFGNDNPLGKTIRTENGELSTITLVFADLPENSHVKYDYLTSYNLLQRSLPPSTAARSRLLGNISDFTYLVMSEGYDIAKFKDFSEAFYSRYMEPMFKPSGMSWQGWLQPLADIHLHSDVGSDLPTGNLLYLYSFSAVAVFILVVACINYINLATARYAKRTREVGMCKILGVGRGELIFQFLLESLCLTFIALVLGIVVVKMVFALTPINTLLDKALTFDLAAEPALVWWLLGLSLFIGLVSGLYPAFYLSSVEPILALMTINRPGRAGIVLRELLVLIQFTISVGVIACTLLMAAQMRYMANKTLGFEKENRIIINLRGVDLIEKIPILRTELLKNSNILGITTSGSMMGKSFQLNSMPIENNKGEYELNSFHHISVESNFFDVMGMRLIEGRDFSRRLLTDIDRTLVVNESMVELMKWDEPLGKHIRMNSGPGMVIGVVNDFHFASLHNKVGPFAFYPFEDKFDNIPQRVRPFVTRNLVLNVVGENMRQTLNFLEEKFSEFDPRHPFEFEFLDESLNKLYASEERLMKLTGIFAAICIFIACLGLFGLTAFTTELRTKEIGIRKIIGATTTQIILLLGRNILKLVLLGALIASLLSWYAMQEWLTGFAYHTRINPLIFLLSTLVAAILAYITLALQSYKTVGANPMHALRYE